MFSLPVHLVLLPELLPTFPKQEIVGINASIHGYGYAVPTMVPDNLRQDFDEQRGRDSCVDRC